MKKNGIALLALLLCLGGMTPMVFAEEIETEPEEVTVEDIQNEVTDEAEEAVTEEASSEEEEIVEETVQEEPAERVTEEEKQPRTGYEVLPTEHGTVSVTSSKNDLFNQGNYAECWKISCTPDDGYHVASVKARDVNGIEIDLIHDDENNYYLAKGVSVTIDAVFDGNPHPLPLNPDETHDVTLMVDSKPVTMAKTGQRVEAVIDHDSNEYVSSFVIRDPNNIPYKAELISETENQTVYQFAMINDEIILDIRYGAFYAKDNGTIHKIATVEKINSSENLTLTTGWYVVNGNVTVDKRIEINGNVNLILPDDTTFTCKEGIHNREGNSLTIWGHKKGNGCLDIELPYPLNAGIGGDENENGGTFNLHGGRINSEGGRDAAGVGGGYRGDGGKIRVYGGYLHGHGNNNAAGIGGGEYGRGGDIRIYGGQVYGEGDYYDWNDWFNAGGAGIGGGEDRDGGYIEINGGIVTALGGIGRFGAGAGIGGGDQGSGGTILINGGKISATSESKGAGIGGGVSGKSGIITINGGIINATSKGAENIGNGFKYD